MALPNEAEARNYDKEVHQKSYSDGNGNIYQTKQTTEKVDNKADSYGRGYIHGQAAERSTRRRIVQQNEDNTARGLLLGSLLAIIAILTGGFIWYINQQNDSDVLPVAPIIIPNGENPESSPSPSPITEPQTRQESTSETTIIEKVREVPIPVPVPQQTATEPQTSQPQTSQPQSSQQPQTEININPVTPETSEAENNTSEANPQPQTETNSNQNAAQ